MSEASGHSRLAKWTRRVVYAVFLLALLAAAVLSGLIWYKPSPTQVSLAGDSLTLGAHYGRELKVPMRLVTHFYLDQVVCQGDSKQVERGRAAALRSLTNWPVPYRDELTAMAEAARIPVGALAFGNTFLDLGRAQAGCRSVVLSHSNRLFHAHNLDWDNLGGLGRWATCIVRRQPTDGRFATVSVGFPGMIGALDIINEKGLALSFNQLGWGKGLANEPVLILLRRIAETCDSLEAARTNLIAVPEGMPFIITVSDSRAGQGSVFERIQGRVVERQLQGGFVAACNAPQGTISGTTKLDRRLAQATISDWRGLGQILADPEVLLGCNIYSVIFDFHHNRLWLASGEVPAAQGRYREYPLFR